MAGQTVEGIREGIAQHWVQAINEIEAPRIVALVIGHSSKHVARGIAKRAITAPFQAEPEDMASYFNAADLTVVTSEFEAFGRIAAESEASGTPVVCFQTGGLPEIVLDKKTGYVVPKGDTVKLKLAIEKLASNHELLSRMSIAGIRHARENFCDSLIVDRYVEQYRREILVREQ